jgi:hypothetical protein
MRRLTTSLGAPRASGLADKVVALSDVRGPTRWLLARRLGRRSAPRWFPCTTAAEG